MNERRILWLSAVASILACCLVTADIYFRGRGQPIVSPHATSTYPISPDYKALSVEELAMRFRHPEFYEDRGMEVLDPVPRRAALDEMIRRRLVRRGIRTEEAEYLLGTPYNAHGDVSLRQLQEWHYGGVSGTLSVQFDDDHRLSGVFQAHDGPPDSTRTVDNLLTGKQ